jgi:hypothetical protein
MKNGASAEIAVVGNEGIVGVSLFMGGESTPSRAVVQSSGTGFDRRQGTQLVMTQDLIANMLGVWREGAAKFADRHSTERYGKSSSPRSHCDPFDRQATSIVARPTAYNRGGLGVAD